MATNDEYWHFRRCLSAILELVGGIGLLCLMYSSKAVHRLSFEWKEEKRAKDVLNRAIERLSDISAINFAWVPI